MKEKHFIGTVTQKVILLHQNKFLIERHKGIWHLPGGRLNLNEFLEDGLIREIKEELGLELHNPKLFKALTFLNRYNEQKFALIYTEELDHHNPSPQLTLQVDEIDEIKWITINELESMAMYQEFKTAIQEYFSH